MLEKRFALGKLSNKNCTVISFVNEKTKTQYIRYPNCEIVVGSQKFKIRNNNKKTFFSCPVDSIEIMEETGDKFLLYYKTRNILLAVCTD